MLSFFNFFVLSLCFAGNFSAGVDLSKVYPATMDSSSSGLTWTSNAEDVWRLSSFEIKLGSKLDIHCKKANVVFGVHDTNVVWAVVFPDDPAQIRTSELGDKEHAQTILLRFGPSEIGRIFPAKTVTGNGPAYLRTFGSRVFRHKIGWRWSTPAGNPTIVPRDFLIVDADTVEGARRFYGVNRQAGSVEYVAEFQSKPLPPLATIDKAKAAEVFEEVWEAFDREYAMFVLLPDVNWDKLGKQYRKVARSAKTTFELAAVLAELIAHLEDLHAWVRTNADSFDGYQRHRPQNGNLRATIQTIGSTREAGQDIVYGQTEDGIGYLGVTGLSDEALPEHVDQALEALAGTWGLIIDLRFNGGGGEDLAGAIASRFVDRERVYSKHQYRNGPKHKQLGKINERAIGPRGWRYEAPVVALWGQKTLSSAESLALMLQQCPQVTSMGDRTGGSSGNPRRLKFPCGIEVNMPRWIDMDPEGNAIERVGISPTVRLEFEQSDFTQHKDPIIDQALEFLRDIPKPERVPGKP